jgi:peptide chain release factor 1
LRPGTTGQGNFAVSLLITGEDLACLDAEAGGHRWQRIPPTEKRGRVHTSTVTVSVTDPTVAQAFELKEKDLSLSWYSGSGSGGQHRNKHQNCARLTHVPSGITVTAQTRSRENSLQQARAALVERLQTDHAAYQHNTFAQQKKSQVGSGQRGDKIRTYRLQHDEVCDHRTDKRINCRQLERGFIDLLW